jgi:hypothetical protein
VCFVLVREYWLLAGEARLSRVLGALQIAIDVLSSHAAAYWLFGKDEMSVKSGQTVVFCLVVN